jgi:hypothetical protein
MDETKKINLFSVERSDNRTTEQSSTTCHKHLHSLMELTALLNKQTTIIS